MKTLLILFISAICSFIYAGEPEELSGKYIMGPDGVRLAAVTLVGEINEDGKSVPFEEQVRTFILFVALIDPVGKNPPFIFATKNLAEIENIQNSVSFEVQYKRETNSFTVTGQDKQGKIIYTHELKVRAPEKKKEEKKPKVKPKPRRNTGEVMVT